MIWRDPDPVAVANYIMNGSALESNLKVVLSSLVENVNKTGYNISKTGYHRLESID
jgi:hypothetical protein